MRINISIEDATQEELQRFIGMTATPKPQKVKLPATKGAKTNFCTGKWSDAEREAVLSVGEDDAWKN